MTRARVKLVALSVSMALLAGCAALHPAGEKAERKKAAQEGRAWKEPVDLPDLGPDATQDDYARYALLNNADLQMRYWQWRSAIERIPQSASFPNVALPFSLMLGGGSMKLWDRATLGVTNDPMTNIPAPSKLRTAGRRDLEDARAAGERFQETKFLLQGRVLSTYYDLALLGESIRIEEEDVALLRLIARQASIGIATGRAGQQDLLRAQTELQMAENRLENLKAQAPGLVARMNALLGRGAAEPVPLPKALPSPRPLAVADDELISMGSQRSRELAALGREIAGRKEALALAKQQYIPDFGLSASVTGTVSGMLGGMLILPTRREAIKAGIEQARADLKAASAARAQYERDLGASFILNLYILRNDERQVELFERGIIPRARETVKITQSAYATGRTRFIDLLDAERTLLDARQTEAELRTEREKALAAIETWSTVDVETMARGATPLRAVRMGSSSAGARPQGAPASSGAGGGMGGGMQ